MNNFDFIKHSSKFFYVARDIINYQRNKENERLQEAWGKILKERWENHQRIEKARRDRQQEKLRKKREELEKNSKKCREFKEQIKQFNAQKEKEEQEQMEQRKKAQIERNNNYVKNYLLSMVI